LKIMHLMKFQLLLVCLFGMFPMNMVEADETMVSEVKGKSMKGIDFKDETAKVKWRIIRE